jgi:protein-tyrosine-phosphatase
MIKRVLFVDVQNSVRSPMAAAWFNSLVPYGYRALSCGTIPAPAVDPLAVQAMHAAGLELGAHFPTRVTPQMLASVDAVVLMGKELRTRSQAPTYVWNFRDPAGQPVETYLTLSSAIRRQVQQLIVALKLMPYSRKKRAATANFAAYRL